MTTPFTDKHILLCVTGSIACYKAADLASKLTQQGAKVDVLLTKAALEFVTPLTFQSVTGRRAYTDADLWGSEAHVLHVGLGHQADLLVIAPATANTIAKLASGLADNLVAVTALAAHCPLLLAPAMDGGMFNHPATQANLELLRQRGVQIVGPAQGHLASGLEGIGRMVEPLEILGEIRRVLARGGPLSGRKVVVTAGGTQEPIDPVRSLTNRSSGKQGFSLAQAALDRGAEVTLIAGSTALPTPPGARRLDVITADEMLAAVLREIDGADVLLMAAAVADFRPAAPEKNKIRKSGGIPEIRLENTPDILKEVARHKSVNGFPKVTVGFAAESESLLENAQAKLEAKKLDLIVANDITARDAGFAVDTNRVTILSRLGNTTPLPLLSKEDVAHAVLDQVQLLLRASSGPIVHLCSLPDWEAAQRSGEYRPAAFEQDGFIHCSHPEQVLDVANRFYRDLLQPVLLWIDPKQVKPEVRWELSDGQLFPHIYGPLNLDSVFAVTSLQPGEDGLFRSLPDLGQSER